VFSNQLLLLSKSFSYPRLRPPSLTHIFFWLIGQTAYQRSIADNELIIDKVVPLNKLHDTFLQTREPVQQLHVSTLQPLLGNFQ